MCSELLIHAISGTVTGQPQQVTGYSIDSDTGNNADSSWLYGNQALLQYTCRMHHDRKIDSGKVLQCTSVK